MANRSGNSRNSVKLYFLGSKITADGDYSHEIITIDSKAGTQPRKPPFEEADALGAKPERSQAAQTAAQNGAGLTCPRPARSFLVLSEPGAQTARRE